MKVLITGIKGQLGYDVKCLLEEKKYDILGVDYEEMDLTNEEQVTSVLTSYQPDVIVHCAAYTAVDNAENDYDLCYDVNVNGTKYLSTYAKENDILMVYFSTDYVFDGKLNQELAYQVSDKIDPINKYGLTKYLGEEKVKEVNKHYILRISWVFGINGNNFIKTMLRLSKTNKQLKIVDDQVGSPTYTKDVASLVYEMIQRDNYGTYHVTNEGYCTWFEFASEIFKQANIDIDLIPVTSSEFKAVAKRPSNSKMKKDKLEKANFCKLPTWQDALKRYLIELEVN